MTIVAAIGTAAAAALASKIVGDLYELVKKKMSGSGLVINHRNKNEKKQFLIEFLEKSKWVAWIFKNKLYSINI